MSRSIQLAQYLLDVCRRENVAHFDLAQLSTDTQFRKRLRRVVDEVYPAMKPEELARFLEEPNASLDGLRPWDLLSVSDESEFERVLAILPRRP